MTAPLKPALAILRRKQVEERTGLSRSSIYAMKARGEFPQPVKLTAKAVGWRLRDIEDWLESRAQFSQKVAS